eukprot:TRINITY_DN28691_c0_g1_i1.p2 TRINITY_DN28691_c0_g1~~TRINITY_DN28691_c0_g1_i1.p2  ORF type:complete len:103 (-),score=11.75 TRINITY_DN28691_c0_g1_i1:25-333(-)
MTKIKLTLEAYGRAVIVKGDSKPVKSSMMELGGRWNPTLGGWIFMGSHKDKVLKGLKRNSSVASVIDRAGDMTKVMKVTKGKVKKVNANAMKVMKATKGMKG